MQTTQFDQLLAQIDRLSADDQRKLQQVLAERLVNGQQPPQNATMTEDEFEQHLLNIGLLSYVPPPITDFTPFENREPVKIQGPPLSRSIVADRR